MEIRSQTAYLPGEGALAGREPPLRIGVLVGLERGERAGGHVRFWERIAAAAQGRRDDVDLTVHFLGDSPGCAALAETVRFVTDRPVFSTRRLPFLSHIPDVTDLAPWHGSAAHALARYEVIHTTDAYFAYARTALQVSRRRGIPLVNSVHTNTPELTRTFTAQTIERLVGRTVVGRPIQRLGLPDRIASRMSRQLGAYQGRCAFVWESRPDRLAAAEQHLPGRVGLLRRGVDRALFNPARRDRQWLAACYGIPLERFTMIYVGRLDCTKGVPFLVDVVRMLLSQGVDVHLVCAGNGPDRRMVEAALGPRATCPGTVAPDLLARLYASSHVLAFPSRIEESANVVFEAMSAGLPALVSREGAMASAIADGETGFALAVERPRDWTAGVARLVADRGRLKAMSIAARRRAEAVIPSWEDVLEQDLLPHWRSVARGGPHADGLA